MNEMTKQERVQKFKDILCAEVNPYETTASEYTTKQLCEALDEMGYFDVPASLKYHGAFEGGLFVHSLNVATTIADYTEKLGLKWTRQSSPWIVGLFHDLCKCDNYIRTEQSSTPGVLQGWNYKNKKLLAGHGDKSVMLLSQFRALTEEEVLCIRYHMGAYEQGDWDGFDLAIRKYPNVLYTHTADMYASKILDD